MDIQTIKHKEIDVVDSKVLHKVLGVASYHADWIRRRIDGYGFEEGVDYWKLEYSKMSNQDFSHGGARAKKDYLLTFDMAKELAMIENSEVGKMARRYFIKAEKELRKISATRLAGKIARRTMTDLIQEKKENERMKGRGYSNYTLLAYHLTGLKERYKNYEGDNFRDSLDSEDLESLETVEDMIKQLLKLDRKYKEIKFVLEPIFNTKAIAP